MSRDDERPFRRADFLRQGFAFLLGKAVEGIESLEERFVERRFRPPGAIDETAFLATCQRCSHCVEACVPGILRVVPAEAGVAAGTPYLDPHTGPCQMCPDLPCISACPSGALRPIPLASVKIGLAVLTPERCVTSHGQECQVCLDVCPMPEKAVAFEGGHPRILDDRCTGCGICAFACVARPPALRIRKSGPPA